MSERCNTDKVKLLPFRSGFFDMVTLTSINSMPYGESIG
ncbi:Uncharacterised protein [Vibrio cholerae]|nr:Uncharacterised protein [Vibrio cholerae]CSI50225.1 Uncharacterised protein [Vibrio cholerae]